MTTLPATGASTDDVVFLIGRPPIAEYIGFVANQALNGDQADQKALAAQWRTANDHVKGLETAESGISDGVPIAPIDPSLQPLHDQVVADPFFQKSFTFVPVSIGVVELDRLVVFQKQINLTYAQNLATSLGAAPSADALFRFCLPFDHPQPPVRSGRIANNSYVFYSPSTDFRFLDASLLRPQQISDYQTSGPASAFLALAVGFGSNFVNVVSAEGRLVLNNGSHRAYALRSLGITHAPCVVQHVSRREELEVVNQILQAEPDRYLKEPRPSLLKDYFDPLLCSVHPVPRRARQVKVSFGVETVDVPSA